MLVAMGIWRGQAPLLAEAAVRVVLVHQALGLLPELLQVTAALALLIALVAAGHITLRVEVAVAM